MRLAIVAHNALGALRDGGGRHIGGIERQVSLMAKWLASRGHSVSVLVWDEGQGPDLNVDGVRIVPICSREAGVPVLRFFHPRWTGLIKALERSDAELYYQNGAEYVTGQVAAWCRWADRPMVYSTASDPDCRWPPERLTSVRERTLYRYGVRTADRVVVQTVAQQQALQSSFGRSAVVLPMGAVDPYHDDSRHLVAKRLGAPFRVCWVGRMAPVKRLEWLFDVAERLPDIAFDVVASPDSDASYVRTLTERAAALRNITWHGRLPPNVVQQVYAQARVLCCTSSYEGFPNTFLEAWAQGLPIVSTVDPDGILVGKGVGLVASTPEEIAARLLDIASSPAVWAQMSERCRAFFLSQFESNVAFGRFEDLFAETLSSPASRRATERRAGGKELSRSRSS